MTDKDIADIYRDMELQLIESMKRNLGLHIAEEGETQLEYPQWQAIKLKELRKYQKQNRDIIKRSLRGLPVDVAQQLRDELKQGHESEISKYRKIIGEEKFRSSVAMNESFFKLNTRKIDGLIAEIKQSLRKAEHAALRMSNDVYRDVIAKSALYVSNGVMTPAQAIDMATKDFLNRGINCIEYKDGRRVNIADYCDMAVKTANQRAYLIGEGEFRKKIGRTLVIISKHNTSCPLCRPFERKVLIDDVYSGGKQTDGDYMLMSQAMQLGLFHPRCRHGLGTYYPELEDINGYETADNILNDYGVNNRFFEKPSELAHIDNMIQKYKRFVVGCLDPENVSRYQERLEFWKEQKAEFFNDKEDVTEEYIKNATPGKGSISYSEDYYHKHHTDEIKRAEWIHKIYGGDIKLLAESKEKNKLTPDYLWRGKMWELKNISSINSADKNFQKALKQIADNPGGVILDCGNNDTDYLKLVSAVDHRYRRSGDYTVDVMIIKNNSTLKIFRYRKKRR